MRRLALVGFLSACSAHAEVPKIEPAPVEKAALVEERRDEIRDAIEREWRKADELTDQLMQESKEMSANFALCAFRVKEIVLCTQEVVRRTKELLEDPIYRVCETIQGETNIAAMKARIRCRREKFIVREDPHKVLKFHIDSNRCAQKLVSCANEVYYFKRFGVRNLQN